MFWLPIFLHVPFQLSISQLVSSIHGIQLFVRDGYPAGTPNMLQHLVVISAIEDLKECLVELCELLDDGNGILHLVTVQLNEYG